MTAPSRDWHTVARKRFGDPEWVTGTGPYAVLAHCKVLTITLHRDHDAATAARRFIDRTGCGGGCHRDHAVVNLEGVAR